EVAFLYATQSTSNVGTDPLVLYLELNGSLEDASQFVNDAESYGTQAAHDRFGYATNALHFDGNSQLTLANSNLYNTPFTTVSFWVNLSSIPATGEAFLLTHGGWQERWKISLPPHGKPVWTTNNSGGISDMDSGDGNELTIGTWTHVVMSHGPLSDR